MIDAHIHYAASLEADRLNQIMKKYKLKGVALLCIPKGNMIPVEADAFAFQKQSEVPVYVFGALHRDVFSQPLSQMKDLLVMEVNRLMNMGCNGIKMLEGKPNVRKQLSVPDFDSPVWERYWDLLETKQIPVYMHVNDPEEYWDENKATEIAKKAGWCYDHTFVNNEEQYQQVLHVLERHPDLRILFPHFFFLSKNLDRLEGILDNYKNVYIDVTPGVELFYNLSEQRERAAAFFAKFQDRICYGTDIGARSVIYKENIPLSIEESDGRIGLITRFLEENCNYILRPDGYYVEGTKERQMHGLGLDSAILDKIYESNFLRFSKIRQ